MANIIGEVFDGYVREQINQRQLLLGLGLPQSSTTTDDVTLWKTNNSSWVRMISSVDISDTKAKELGVSNLVGSNLAKNFILYNGVSSVTTDSNNTITSFNPASNNTEYFTNNKDFSIRNSYGFGGLIQGIRPMPGIESVKIGYINQGFLAQAEIEITAFNREQLYLIDALFMHPGYSFLLEWGHTRYIDNTTGNIVNIDPSNLITTPFQSVLQPVKKTSKGTGIVTQYNLLNSIKSERQKRSGNYDGFFGIVKNFRYSYQPNGTYKITIIAINQGDIIENLKINTVNPEFAGSAKKQQEDAQARQQKLDDLQKRFNEVKPYIDTNGVLDPKNEQFKQFIDAKVNEQVKQSDFDFDKSGEKNKVSVINNEREADAYELAKSEASRRLISEYTELKNSYESEYEKITGENIAADNLVDRYAKKSKINKQLYTWKNAVTKDSSLSGVLAIQANKYEVDSSDTQGNLTTQGATTVLYYVRLGKLLSWLEENLLLYNVDSDTKTAVPYIKIDSSYDSNYCLHFPKHISANPKVCLIPVKDGDLKRQSKEEVSKQLDNPIDENGEPKYLNLKDVNKILNPKYKEKELSEKDLKYGLKPAIYSTPDGKKQYLDDGFFVKNNTYIANMMHMWVNLEFLSATANDNIDEKGNLTLITFLKETLNGINAALGYIHNFDVVYDREENTVKIYDQNILKYGNKKLKGNNVSQFVVNGFEDFNIGNENKLFGSFVEDVNFTSELNNNFTNMVTIASQTDTNVLGMDVTGLQRFNKGLEDRILRTKKSKEEINNNNKGLTSEDLNNMLKSAVGLADEMWGAFNISDSDIDIFMSLNRDIANYYVNKAVKNQDIPSPLVIPFNLSMTMMGLSGIRIYERFNVDTKILPPMFDNNGYNFITKAVSHEIKNNKWITTLESQVINKEDPNVPDIPISDIEKTKLQTVINQKEIQGCPSWTPKQGSTPSVLTPNQVILDSLKESGYTTTATLESFKKDAPSNIKFATIIATQEGYGSKSTLGYKNNNPGNIVGKGNNGSETKTVTRGKSPKTYTYAKYKTKKDGWDALINKYVKGWINQGNLLPYAGCVVYPDCFKVTDNNYFKSVNIPYQEGIQYNYKAKEIPTLRQYLYQFCPPSAEGQDTTNGYIANVYTSLKSFGVNITSIDEPMTNYIK